MIGHAAVVLLRPNNSFKPKTNRCAIVFGLIQALGIKDSLMRLIATALMFWVPVVGLACDPGSIANTSAVSPALGCKALMKRITYIPPKASWEACLADREMASPKAKAEYVAWEKTVKNWPKNSKIPPPPPPHSKTQALGPMDPAHCALLDPKAAVIESCLVDAVIDNATVKNPSCPGPAHVTIGDLAFFILVDRHPTLWNKVVPGGQSADYYTRFKRPVDRIQLQRRIKSALMPNNSFKPKPLRGSA